VNPQHNLAELVPTAKPWPSSFLRKGAVEGIVWWKALGSRNEQETTEARILAPLRISYSRLTNMAYPRHRNRFSMLAMRPPP